MLTALMWVYISSTGRQIILFACLTAVISLPMESGHRFINLRVTKLLFFVFRYLLYSMVCSFKSPFTLEERWLLPELLVFISCFYILLKLIFIFSSGVQTNHLSLEVLQKMVSWTFGIMTRCVGFSADWMSEFFILSAFLTLINVGCRLVKR